MMTNNDVNNSKANEEINREIFVDLQLAVDQTAELPSAENFEKWVKLALVGANYHQDVEVTIRIVELAEIQQLNKDYRHQDKPTNVLSFPFEAPPGIELPLIGDLVICRDIVVEEAKTQAKNVEAHWAHMIIHGILHLLGYDHIEIDEASIMEALEIKLLESLGIANPYEISAV